MKLGEIKSAIRKTKGNPWFDCYPFPGTDKTFRFHLQKTPLLEELDKAYPSGKTAETGLIFDADTGQLKPDRTNFEAIPASTPLSEVGAPAHEDDDLLLDDSADDDDGLLV